MTSTFRLSPEEFRAQAETPLEQVFKSFDFTNEPFADFTEYRFILDVGSFVLDERLFWAVCEGAQASGDDHLLYSMVKGYVVGPEFPPYYTWQISLFDYDGYMAAGRERTISEHEIGIPLDRVLYSPNGNWGLLFSDPDVLVGGKSVFVSGFKTAYPEWRAGLDSFIEGWLEAAHKRHADVSWVPRLLRHMYGESAPDFAP